MAMIIPMKPSIMRMPRNEANVRYAFFWNFLVVPVVFLGSVKSIWSRSAMSFWFWRITFWFLYMRARPAFITFNSSTMEVLSFCFLVGSVSAVGCGWHRRFIKLVLSLCISLYQINHCIFEHILFSWLKRMLVYVVGYWCRVSGWGLWCCLLDRYALVQSSRD